MTEREGKGNAIEVAGLKKSYGAIEAVKGIDFYVERGALFAFLGPNGAGKSTTIDMLCTQLRPDAGSAFVNGFELGRQDDAIRNGIGVVFQDNVLDGLLTVEENLRVRGSLYGLSKEELSRGMERAMAAAEVGDFRRQRYGRLSGGQRRRADIARALVNTPDILFLDEPTTGLDPQTRRSVWETVRSLQRERGMTVFLTTHYMEEAASADYVAVIDHGALAARGTPQALRERFAKDCLRFTARDAQACLAALGGREAQARGNAFEVKLRDSMEALPLLDALREHIESFEVVAGSMEDAFLAIAGTEMREDT